MRRSPVYRQRPEPRGARTSGPSPTTGEKPEGLLRTAEVLESRGLDVVLLPVSGRTVEIRVPRTQHAIDEGIFPLQLSLLDLERVEPEARESALQEANRCARKTICACSISPRFVDRKARGAKFDEIRVDALCPEDFTYLYRRIVALIERAICPAETVPSEATIRGKKALSLACARFGVDPTEAEGWPVSRSQALLDYFLNLEPEGKR